MGIRTVMITGDNPRTAATIAREAGVDDFIAEARPEDKIAFIRREQADGHLVAMTGDGTNDAPALAQADVGLAMNSGTSASKEAANMVDLDSDPTKLLEVIAIGKQLLITRGSITTFSVANDVAVMLSPALHDEFGVPYLNRLSDAFGGVYIHSCGDWTHLFSSLETVRGLRGLAIARGRGLGPCPARKTQGELQLLTRLDVIAYLRRGADAEDKL